MEYNYLDLTINYDCVGEGAPILLLHGWGTNLHTFDMLIQQLRTKYKVYAIDLVGFGMSDEPEEPWNVLDYTVFLETFIKDMQLIRPILLGHSFGGRIAIKYAARNSDVTKLILVDSAGIKAHQSIAKKYRVIVFKCKKHWYKWTKNIVAYNRLYQNGGSIDYKNASMMMKATLSKVVKEDLKKDMKKIKTETLLMWGKNDETTPYKDALKMKQLIPNSGLVTFENVGHFPYLETKQHFLKVLQTYLEIEA